MQQRAKHAALTGLAGAVLVGGITAGVVAKTGAAPASADQTGAGTPSGERAPAKAGGHASGKKRSLVTGRTTASYFWDDGSGVRGDTGAPASGKPMQKGMF